MDAFLQQFQHLKIQLEDITSATDNFNNQNCIGGGGFGKVYKGEVSHSKGRSMVAIKRLDPKYGQGIPEFLKEITTLSRYSHENLISLLGFCYQGDEMILVYNYASRGSLDRYLNSPHLTWPQRLKICLDAAKGLSYLHDPRETHQRLIHCDVKSANILLDDQWNGKVSDFGLSIMGPANEQQSVIVTLAAGTTGYCDPQYAMTHTLTKESDVYSFGVVLIEVISGKLCCTYSKDSVKQNLVRTWIKLYEEKKLNDLTFKNPIIQALDESVLETFSDIAYRCLKESREDRPKMAEVVTELEIALGIQKLWEGTLSPPPQESCFKTKSCEGVLFNNGKTYFSLNKKGNHCEMISIAECLGLDVKGYTFNFPTRYNSRFAVGTYCYPSSVRRLKMHVKTQFLSSGITYAVNLVFKFSYPSKERRCSYTGLEYKLQGDVENSISHLAYEREDGWWICELYQFTSDHRKTVDLKILLKSARNQNLLAIEGIEFWPLEKVEHIDEKQPISDSDVNWEENLPNDFEDIMKRSEESLKWTTKEEAYSIFRKGFLIKNGIVNPFVSHDKMKKGIWFSLDKNGKKCHMLSAALMMYGNTDGKMFLPESRFGEAIQWDAQYINIETQVQSQLVSYETTYACYLVYKLPEGQTRFKAPMKVEGGDSGDKIWYSYLTSPQTPVIRPKAGQNTHNLPGRLITKGLPQHRNDGWIEVQIWELRTNIEIYLKLLLKFADMEKISGLIIDGIEFRPI